MSPGGGPPVIDDPSSSDVSRMWGGRFAAGPSAVMEAINVSIDFNSRLIEHDIVASKAHATMLARQRIIMQADGETIVAGLDQVLEEAHEGRLALSRALEDVHMNVENRLAEIIGETAGRLHTARSRNDQVATDFRLWVRDAVDWLDADVRALQAALIEQAEPHAATVMPGFTHLQAAQPVGLFGHHLLAYVEMLGRDRGRLGRLPRAAERMPLGGGGAGRHLISDRQADDRRSLEVRAAMRQFAGRRLRPGFRPGVPCGGLDTGGAPVAAGGGDPPSGHASSSASSACPTSSRPAARSCHRNATPMPPS